MLLKSIKLENIRSFISQEINFPQGTILLSGDIGAGKSTILLAIEFALFGILPGELSGNALLRNGAAKGSAELNFEINHQDIIIYRTLKRSKDSVMQGNGYIVKNRMKKDATPVELKTEILNLLGYPKELLTKSKNMIYRYTVYTPQEDMKKIIQEDPAVRLDILRKLFDIDKYKRIQDNTTMYARMIKEQQKEKAGMTADLEEKKKQRDARHKEFAQAEKEIQQLTPKVEAAKLKVEHKRKAMKDTEEKQKQYEELRRINAVKETEISAKKEQHSRNEIQIKEIRPQINKLKEELKGKEVREVTLEQIKDKNKQITALENEIRNFSIKKAEHDADRKRSEELKKKITRLDNCPTCFQIVDKTHKQKINEKEDEKIQEAMLHTSKYETQIKEKEEALGKIKQEIDELRNKEKEQAIIRLKKSSLEDKEKQLASLTSQQDFITKAITRAEQDKNLILQQLKQYEGTRKELEEQQKELNYLLDDEKKTEIEYTKILEQKKNTQAMLTELDKEIINKEKIKKELLQLQGVKTWLQDYFLKLTETIEKQVMTRAYYEFNELMQTWFNALVEDETMMCRLDDTFTPVIMQNGYETELDNLSGGEKTACALAYRLALNKVINNLITSINTKDLLILDEPTDGFSTEQLDKMREVLEQLGMKQIIIVSHESKVETFVDEVIRISKNEHVSEIHA